MGAIRTEWSADDAHAESALGATGPLCRHGRMAAPALSEGRRLCPGRLSELVLPAAFAGRFRDYERHLTSFLIPMAMQCPANRQAERRSRAPAARCWRPLVAAAACLAWPRVSIGGSRGLRCSWREYAEQAPDGAAATGGAARWASAGWRGSESLVRLAGSPRAAVAAAVQDGAADQLTAWETEFRACGRRGELLGRRLVVLAGN